MAMRSFTVFLILALLNTSCQRNSAPPAESTRAPQINATEKTKTHEQIGNKALSSPGELKFKPMPIEATGLLQSRDSLAAPRPADDYKALYESGYQKHNAGDFQGAIADFSKAIAANPKFPDPWHFRGMSRYKSGDKNGACSDWQQAVVLGASRSQTLVDAYCR